MATVSTKALPGMPFVILKEKVDGSSAGNLV
jgi:hypothetical protein